MKSIVFSSTLLILGYVIVILFSGCETKTETSAPKIKDGFVTGADEVELYYQIRGTGQDTIIVVHGGPGAGMFTVIPMIQPLAETFTLIFYDQRGGGRSTLPEDTTQLQPYHFVEDLEAVCNHFGLERMNVITHSFGSVLLAEYVKKYPDRINRMVFHASTGPDRSEAGKYYRVQAAVSTESPDTALTNRATELFQSLLNGTANDPVETCREYEKISRKLHIARGGSTNYQGTTCNAPPKAIRYYYQHTAQLAPRYFGAWDYRKDLNKLTAPLLVVYGEQDTLGIPMQQQWIDAVPNSRLLLVPDAEKGAFSNNPDAVFPEVVEFFRGREFKSSNVEE